MRLQERAIVAPSARLMLVALLVTLAEEEARGDAAPASGILMGASLLKRLAQLSLAEVHRLAETGGLELVVRYDGDQVAWSLQAATRKHTEQALLEDLVRHGAPRALLRELFRISRARIDAVRRSLRLPSTEGRPKLPRRREREAIVAAWSELARTVPDRRVRYRELHGAFPRYSIAALDAVVREASPENPEKGPVGKPVSAPRDRGVRADDPPRRTVVHRRDPK
jgi:hypothetical protein